MLWSYLETYSDGGEDMVGDGGGRQWRVLWSTAGGSVVAAELVEGWQRRRTLTRRKAVGGGGGGRRSPARVMVPPYSAEPHHRHTAPSLVIQNGTDDPLAAVRSSFGLMDVTGGCPLVLLSRQGLVDVELRLWIEDR
ncbi:calcium-binding EF hand family protein [Striga asiatica]|uniref:Calcium-binding EF hand family protein n=1 Tax=Striga asiatica TaxID=4170 RepID=A0A5A7RDW3_STRAF|nr:calcium-binding EF hand family protein [Striga asiatica]